MKKLIVGLMVVGLIGMVAGSAMAATTDSANINLYVTPIVTVNLSLSTTYYDFGNVSVMTSTCSVTALTLTNSGGVGFHVEKCVWDDDGWRVDYSSTTQDGFGLWAMTGASQPGQSSFTTGNTHDFIETTEPPTTFNNLTNNTGTPVTMQPSDTEKLWFRLDMPYSVSSQSQQTINVRLRATAD